MDMENINYEYKLTIVDNFYYLFHKGKLIAKGNDLDFVLSFYKDKVLSTQQTEVL